MTAYRQKFKDWLPEYFESVERPDLAQKYRDKAANIKDVANLRQAVTQGKAPRQTPEQRKQSRKRAAIPSHVAYKADKQSRKIAIDRDTLNLDAVPAALERKFSEGGTGHHARDLQFAKEKTKLAMLIIHGRLEGETLPGLLKKPELQEIYMKPGFFRGKREDRTTEQARQAIQHWWNHSIRRSSRRPCRC